MDNIEWDAEQELLKLKFVGYIREDEIPRFQREIEACLPQLTPGFKILVDLSELEEMAPECIPVIRSSMDSYRERGVSRIVRVIPDPLKDIGFNILSYFHYGPEVKVRTFDNLPDALNELGASPSTEEEDGGDRKARPDPAGGSRVAPRPIDPGVRIGHVHLKVANLDRALAFYCDVLGFEVTQRFGPQAAFISAGGYHHHIGLNTWESAGGSPPPPGSTGLYHLAILYPSRAALADALRRLTSAGIQLDGASDHGVSEALYLHDPDHNGVELYWDRPAEAWPRTASGELKMHTLPLDLENLVKEK